MVNVTLIVTAVVFGLLIIIAAMYFVVYFQHPQDRNVAWFPKIVVIASISLACWNLFLLPLQVANSNPLVSTDTGIPMEKLTLGFYGSTVCMVLIMIPFTVYFYEGEDAEDDGNGGTVNTGAQFAYAFKYMLPTLAVFAGIVAAMYYGGLAYASIATTYLQSPLYDTTGLELESLDAFFSFSFYCNSSASVFALTPKVPVLDGSALPTYDPQLFLQSSTNLPDYGCNGLTSSGLNAVCCSSPVINSVVVSPLVFIVAILTLLGWLLFSIFCGVGMASLPYDLLVEFKHRPKPITTEIYHSRKKQVGQQASILMEEFTLLSAELKTAGKSANFNRKYRAIKNRENSFRKNVMILEYHYKHLEDAYKFQGGNILLQYAKFCFAILSAVLTLLWIIHSILYVIPQTLKNQGVAIQVIDPFLNNMLKLTAAVPIVGIVLYAIFVFYLLACTMKGNAKLGMRIIFFTIHPLIMGETLMSAMTFNAGIILLCSLPICQFAQTAFADYSSSTPNQSIFGVQISRLSAISWGFNFFIYIMLGFCVLTFFYQMYNPFRRKQKDELKMMWED